MNICSAGFLAYHTRVESWDCDYNQHWNARNYSRCFRQAGFVVSSETGHAGRIATQHIRYHRELMQAAPIEVRTAVLADGDCAGALLHMLSSEGRLSATALEWPGASAADLPRLNAADAVLALPKGLKPDTPTPEPHLDLVGRRVTEHAFVQPNEIDHTGSLAFEHLMSRIAVSTSRLLFDLGSTPEYGRQHALSQMSLESRLTRFGHIPTGTRLRSLDTVVEIGRKTLTLLHNFIAPDGAEVARAEQVIAYVDMRIRRTVEVPDFMHEAAAVLPPSHRRHN